MQFDPKADFKMNGLYVIVEQGDVFPSNYCKIIGITHSYDSALKHVTNSYRKIQGPIPVLDGVSDFTLPKPRSTIEYPFNPFIKEFDPLPKPPNLFNTDDFAEKKSINFSMLTPPSSRINSPSTSPNF